MLIKHLAGRGEVLVGHNTWHEYRAMGYRYAGVGQERYIKYKASKVLHLYYFQDILLNEFL